MAKNDITGDDIKTSVSSENYRKGWDLIFNSEDLGENLIASVKQAVSGVDCSRTYVLSEEEYMMYQWYEYLAHNVDSALGPASDDVIDGIYYDFHKETGFDPEGKFTDED